MEAEVKDSFLDYFGEIEDPRSSRNQLYSLSEILFVVFCAYIGGSDGWEDVELFGKTHENFLKRYFPYKNGIPSDDTYRRLFRALDPVIFQEKFRSWVLDNSPKFADGVIAIDGKTSRGSEDGVGEDKHILHMVSAYSTETNIVLAQEKVPFKWEAHHFAA
ncbi:hypothetical protein FACS1894126_6010 [Alphaproteobacteria bacterium]|nr:hypothetical protein FACS1894126_6010 [Alphaproteobacteria bacterium]